MSIARPEEIHEGHPLQPVVRRRKGMEGPDVEAKAMQISVELDNAIRNVVPGAFKGYYTATQETEGEEEVID